MVKSADVLVKARPEWLINPALEGQGPSLRSLWIGLLCAFALGAPAAPEPGRSLTPPGNVGRVLSVKFAAEGNHTRVVIETDNALKYDIFSLAAGSQRIVVDMPRVRWS